MVGTEMTTASLPHALSAAFREGSGTLTLSALDCDHQVTVTLSGGKLIQVDSPAAVQGSVSTRFREAFESLLLERCTLSWTSGEGSATVPEDAPEALTLLHQVTWHSFHDAVLTRLRLSDVVEVLPDAAWTPDGSWLGLAGRCTVAQLYQMRGGPWRALVLELYALEQRQALRRVPSLRASSTTKFAPVGAIRGGD